MNKGFFIQQFELIERWDVPVAMPIYEDEKPDRYEMYATIEAYEEKYGKEKEYQIKCILDMLEIAKDNEVGISIYGVLPFVIDVTYDDIEMLEPELSGVIELAKCMREEISIDEMVKKIEDIPVIFIGEYPDINKGGEFGVHTVKHVKESYEMIPVFLNRKNADEYNKSNYPTTETTIKEIRSFYNQFGIIVEPHKKYWAVIEPESV